MIPKAYLYCELADGSEFNERVTMPVKLAYEKAAKANGWPLDAGDRPYQSQAFMAYWIARRSDRTTATWEDFLLNELVDCGVTDKPNLIIDGDPIDGVPIEETVDGDPTQPAPGIG